MRSSRATWFSPLVAALAMPKPEKKEYRGGGGKNKRSIVIKGKMYPSLCAARAELGLGWKQLCALAKKQK